MKAIFVFAVMLVTFYTSAQSSTKHVSIHDFNKQINKFPEVKKFAKNDDGNYFIWKKEHTVSFNGKSSNVDFVELRDEEMEVVKTVSITELTQGDDKELITATLFNGNLVLFTRKEIKGEGYSLTMQAVDINSLSIYDEKEIMRGEMHKGSEKYLPYTLTYAMAIPPIETCISPDGKYLMVAIRGLYNRKETEKISFVVLNSELEVDWTRKDYKIDQEDRYYLTLSFAVGNIGEVFMLGGLNTMEEQDLDLYRIDDGDVIKTKVAYTHKPKSYQLQLAIHEDKLILAGTYSDKSANHSKGNLVVIFDSESLDVINRAKNEFELEFLQFGLSEIHRKAFSEKMNKGEDVGVKNLELDSIVFVNDEIYVINRRTVITSYNLDGPNYTDYEIIVSKYSLTGELFFVRKIPRAQSKSASRLHKTYVYHATTNGLEFVFGDMPGNMERNFEVEGPVGHYTPKCLASFTVNDLGETKRSMIYNSSENHKKYYLFDFETCQSQDNEVIVVMNLGKEEGTKYVLIK